jgi:transposase-like protein
MVAHSTILRWVSRYVPEYEKRWNRFSRPVGTSWRWRRDVRFHSEANGAISIERSTSRERRSTFSCAVTAASRRAQAFFRKALATNLNRWPRKVTLDGHVPSHRALRLLRREDPKWRNVEVRTRKYLDNVVEQDHRAIKRRCASMAGFKSFGNAAITIAGIELAHRIHKRQFSFGVGRPRRERSLKVLWDRALA